MLITTFQRCGKALLFTSWSMTEECGGICHGEGGPFHNTKKEEKRPAKCPIMLIQHCWLTSPPSCEILALTWRDSKCCSMEVLAARPKSGHMDTLAMTLLIHAVHLTKLSYQCSYTTATRIGTHRVSRFSLMRWCRPTILKARKLIDVKFQIGTSLFPQKRNIRHVRRSWVIQVW